MSDLAPSRRGSWSWLLTAGFVLVAQLALVAAIGTDIPFHDQWNIEGEWLYPRWQDETLGFAELFRPFNEHRIAWTHALNLALFAANGQWDPLLQLVAIAVMRAACAGGLAWYVARISTGLRPLVVAMAVGIAFLPLAPWHTVLWGIESHSYFSLAFGGLTLALLSRATPTRSELLLGAVAGAAGLIAMGPNALVPVALLGLIALRAWERRAINGQLAASALLAGLLLVAGFWLRVDVPAHAALRAHDVGEFVRAALLVLAWPQRPAWLAVGVNVPLLLVLGARLARRRAPAPGEDFVLAAAGWSVAIGLATAWVRGGSAELATAVPSRYADFLVLLPLANAWCAVTLAREFAPRWRIARPIAAGWILFLLLGALVLDFEVMRALVLPRARDRAAPERLTRAFQTTRDPTVFEGQPLLLVPHPSPRAVLGVLEDPRLHGRLPPSLQPEQPLGPGSRAVRALLGREAPRP